MLKVLRFKSVFHPIQVVLSLRTHCIILAVTTLGTTTNGSACYAWGHCRIAKGSVRGYFLEDGFLTYKFAVIFSHLSNIARNHMKICCSMKIYIL